MTVRRRGRASLSGRGNLDTRSAPRAARACVADGGRRLLPQGKAGESRQGKVVVTAGAVAASCILRGLLVFMAVAVSETFLHSLAYVTLLMFSLEVVLLF
ncbi:hypothetical protein E2C01_010611 [Portunus trituberculatus]|uniref:Uncharacterized protein n=1 Tax=Portunus trituberculatus TaxID=210409 RepID=A0A5B7D8V1_PORTR|nr:hypothetical protein [Portunus trituberculatus]